MYASLKQPLRSKLKLKSADRAAISMALVDGDVTTRRLAAYIEKDSQTAYRTLRHLSRGKSGEKPLLILRTVGRGRGTRYVLRPDRIGDWLPWVNLESYATEDLVPIYQRYHATPFGRVSNEALRTLISRFAAHIRSIVAEMLGDYDPTRLMNQAITETLDAWVSGQDFSTLLTKITRNIAAVPIMRQQQLDDLVGREHLETVDPTNLSWGEAPYAEVLEFATTEGFACMDEGQRLL